MTLNEGFLMSTAGISQLLELVPTLAPPAITALLTTTGGVAITDLEFNYTPGNVIATPTLAAYSDPSWGYYGHVSFTYEQLDLGVVLGTFPLSLTILELPSNSGVIAEMLASIFDIALTAEDVVAVSLPTIYGGGTKFTLQAAPSSLMWKGFRDITLYPSALPPADSLQALITVTKLNGLVGP